MAEVTGDAPPNRGSAFVLAGIAGVSLIRVSAWRRMSLCGGRSLVRSVPDIPWGNAQLEILVARCSGLVFRDMELGRSCLSVTDGLPAI
jgi:hypothetical protein